MAKGGRRVRRGYFRRNGARQAPGAAPAREALAEGYMRMYRVLDALHLLQDWLDARPDEVEALSLRGDVLVSGAAAPTLTQENGDM